MISTELPLIYTGASKTSIIPLKEHILQLFTQRKKPNALTEIRASHTCSKEMPGISQSLVSEQLGQTKSAQLYWTWQTKNIQGRARNTEVKQHSKGHIAGQ